MAIKPNVLPKIPEFSRKFPFSIMIPGITLMGTIK